MTDYWAGGNNPAATADANGTVSAPAAEATAGGEDVGMDEISVGSFEIIIRRL